MKNPPNLFLVGHPRSGTGTWDGLLKSHPKIFMADKELHYFGQDLDFNFPARSLENYLAHFAQASNQVYRGDSSTWYLASETAPQEIHQFCPNAKIFISLRDPVQWLHSLHAHQYFSAYETEPDFAKALALEPSRLAQPHLIPNTFPKIGVFYKQLVDYDTQVKRYLDVFGPEQVHISFLFKSKTNIEHEWSRLLSFLELEMDYTYKDAALNSKKQRNANHRSRSRRLQMWLKSDSRRAVLFGLQSTRVPKGRLMLKALRRLNMTDHKRNPMDPELSNQLRREFLPMVERLEKLLDQDLTTWKPKQ